MNHIATVFLIMALNLGASWARVVSVPNNTSQATAHGGSEAATLLEGLIHGDKLFGERPSRRDERLFEPQHQSAQQRRILAETVTRMGALRLQAFSGEQLSPKLRAERW